MFEEEVKFESARAKEAKERHRQELRSTDIYQNEFLRKRVDSSFESFVKDTNFELEPKGNNILKIRFFEKLDMIVVLVNEHHAANWRNYRDVVVDLEDIAEKYNLGFNESLQYYREHFLNRYCRKGSFNNKSLMIKFLNKLERINKKVRNNKKEIKPLVVVNIL